MRDMRSSWPCARRKTRKDPLFYFKHYKISSKPFFLGFQQNYTLYDNDLYSSLFFNKTIFFFFSNNLIMGVGVPCEDFKNYLKRWLSNLLRYEYLLVVSIDLLWVIKLSCRSRSETVQTLTDNSQPPMWLSKLCKSIDAEVT